MPSNAPHPVCQTQQLLQRCALAEMEMEPSEEELRAAPAALLKSSDGRGMGGRSTDSVRRGARPTAAAGSINSGGSDVSRRSCARNEGFIALFLVRCGDLKAITALEAWWIGIASQHQSSAEILSFAGRRSAADGVLHGANQCCARTDAPSIPFAQSPAVCVPWIRAVWHGHIK